MYQRYAPKPGMQPPKQGKPTTGEMNCIKQTMQGQTRKSSQMQGRGQRQQTASKPEKERKDGLREHQTQRKKGSPILSLLPKAVYHPETKKILGLFSAEDLLLIAMIFLLLDSEDTENSVLVYALLYILISEYIDLPF